MKRVAVTGIGAVTPLGLDAPSTWRAALAGESGIGWISTFDTDGLPVRVAGEVKGFDPAQVVSPKEARKLERNVLLGVAAGREALADAGLNGFDPTRVGIIFGSAIGGVPGILEQADVLRERGPDRVSPNFLPNVLVDSVSGQLAISLGITGPNYAVVSACATGSHAVGEAAEMIKRGAADAVLAGGTEACIVPLILAGFTAMRGLAAEDEYPPHASRPFDATRAGLRDGGGRGRAAARGLGARRAARRRDLRRGARLRRLERRAPHGAARAGGDGRRGDDARRARARRRRADARRLHQRARHLHPARRRRRDEGDQGRLRRPRVRARGLVDEVDDGPHLRRRGRDRGDHVRARAARRRAAADDQLPRARSGVRPRLRAERGARGRVDVALSNAMGLGGHNGCVLLGRAD